MLPEKLYIIREILKELDMDYGMSYLTHVYSEMLRQTTRDLYQNGEVEAYKRAVRFEIENNFSTIDMAHEMTQQLAEKVRVHMHVSNRNVAYIESQTGLTTEVINALLKGHGSLENFLTVMMTLGMTLQMKDINTFYIDYVKEEAKNSVAVISPLTYEDYEVAQQALGENIRQFCEVGGNINFNMSSIGNDIIVGGLIDYNMTQADLESSEFKIASKEFLVTVMIYPELRDKLMVDFLKKPNAIAMSLGGKYIITVEHLLNALYQIEGDDAYYMLIPIPYRLRDEEGLLIADCTYEITMNVNGTTTTSKLYISNEKITFRGTIIDGEDTGENGEEIGNGETGETPGDVGGESGSDPGEETPGENTGGNSEDGTDEGAGDGADTDNPDTPTDGGDTGDSTGGTSTGDGDGESPESGESNGTVEETPAEGSPETTTPDENGNTETGTEGIVPGGEDEPTVPDIGDTPTDEEGTSDVGNSDIGDEGQTTQPETGTGDEPNEDQPTEQEANTEVGNNDNVSSSDIAPFNAGYWNDHND